MSDWLEEAERHQRHKERRSSKSSSKILESKEKIKNNYERNRGLYDNFINRLNNLLERINNLPSKDRNEFGKITYKAKESKLNTHLNLYTSSQRQDKRRYKNLLSLFKLSHKKNVRIVYFSVSKEIDMIEVEVKEVSMFRERLQRVDLEKGKKKELRTKSKKNIKEDNKNQSYKIKLLFRYEMEKLDKSFAMEFVDWLAFKKNTGQLNIPEDRIK